MESNGVTDIGLNSTKTEALCNYGTGVIIDVRHSLGTEQELKVTLKICETSQQAHKYIS